MKRLVKIGNVVIPIYELADGRFMPSWREGGRIFQPRYRRLARAKRIAEESAFRIANGRARERDNFTRIKIPELQALFVEEKERSKLSARYLRGLRGDTARFASHFPSWLDEIRALEFSKYLHDLKLGDRRRNNVRDEIVTMFLFAKKHRFLPPDKITEAEMVGRIELDYGPPRIYSPVQLREIVEMVSDEWLDWILLGAFAGIRPEESALPHIIKTSGEQIKLRWESHFLWEDRQIWIPAAISKTKRDRYVTISETLMAWIHPNRGRKGSVCVLERYDRETERLGKILPFDWIQDGLRHSFASYWQSIHRDMPRLKDEMGNSEAVNRRYYYHPQPRSIAESWFKVLPETSNLPNVVALG